LTESTGHLSEYVPWFRKNAKAMQLYCDEPAFGGESGAYYKWGKTMAEKYAKVDPLQFESSAIDCRSVEYCSWIMEAVTTGKPFRFMGNVRNDGYITNLPKAAASRSRPLPTTPASARPMSALCRRNAPPPA
jgi:alpha-galactosidase